MPRVSPQFAEGRACPHCGRPLYWIGRWRSDRHSPDGMSFERKPFVTYLDRKIARDDRQVQRVVARSGYEGKTETRWEHTCTMQCPRCNLMYSSAQASHVPPPPPDRVPAGYYLPEE